MADRHADGFSLLEALIAATLVALAIGAVVELLMRAAEQVVRTERATIAAALAQSRLERLRAVRFAYDAAGGRVDAPALDPSPPDAHRQDTPPYLDLLDRFGAPAATLGDAAYVRRWSIAAPDPDTRRISVCVAPYSQRSSADQAACVWTLRVRQP